MPKKRVVAIRDIPMAAEQGKRSGFVLLPTTNRVGYAETHVQAWLKTTMEIPLSDPPAVITLADPNKYQPHDLAAYAEGAKVNKDTVLEPFWVVARSPPRKIGEVNMKIVQKQINHVNAMTLEDKRMAGGTVEVKMPVMVPTRDIASGEELVVLYEDTGAKPEKRAKDPVAAEQGKRAKR